MTPGNAELARLIADPNERLTYTQGNEWIRGLQEMGLWTGVSQADNPQGTLDFWFNNLPDIELVTVGVGKSWLDANGVLQEVEAGEPWSALRRQRQTPELTAALVQLTADMYDPTSLGFVPDWSGSAQRQLGKLETNVGKVAEAVGADPTEQMRRLQAVWDDGSRRLELIQEALEKGMQQGNITELLPTQDNSAKAILRMLGVNDKESLHSYIEQQAGDTLSQLVVAQVARDAGMYVHVPSAEAPKSLGEVAKRVAKTMTGNTSVLQVRELDGDVLAESVGLTKDALIQGMRVLLPKDMGESAQPVANMIAKTAAEIVRGLDTEAVEINWTSRIKAAVMQTLEKVRGADSVYVPIRDGVIDLPSSPSWQMSASAVGIAGLIVGAPYVAEQLQTTTSVVMDAIQGLDRQWEDMIPGTVTLIPPMPESKNVIHRVNVTDTRELGKQWEALPSDVRVQLTKIAQMYDGNVEKWRTAAQAELTRLGGEFARDPAAVVEMTMNFFPLMMLSKDKRVRALGMIISVMALAKLTGCANPPGTVTAVPTQEATKTPIATSTPFEFPTPASVNSNETQAAPTEASNIVLPDSLADFDLSDGGGSQEQLRKAIQEMSLGDVEDMEGWWIARAWRDGLLTNASGQNAVSYEEAVSIFGQRYRFVYDVTDTAWLVVPQEISSGRIGYATDANGIPFASLMPLGVPNLDSFQMKFAEMVPGGAKQMVAHTQDGKVFSIIVADAEGKPVGWMALERGEMQSETLTQLDLESWQELFYGNFVGGDGKERPYSNYWSEEQGTTSTNPDEILTFRPGSFVVHMPNGEIVFNMDSQEAAEAARNGAVVRLSVKEPGFEQPQNIQGWAWLAMQVAERELKNTGEVKIRIRFDDYSTSPGDGDQIYFKLDDFRPVLEDGKLTTPTVEMPKYFLVMDAQGIVMSSREITDQKFWLEQVKKAGGLTVTVICSEEELAFMLDE